MVEPGRQLHFDAPGLAFPPAVFLEVIGDRGQGIGRVFAAEIGHAVVIEVDAELEHCGGHELPVPDRTGPRSLELVGPDPAQLHQPQGRKQLGLEIGCPPPGIGEGRERRDHRRTAHDHTVTGLEPPDRRDDFRLDAEGVFDGVEQIAVRAQHLPAIADPFVRRGDGEIFLQGKVELLLTGLAFEHFGQTAHLGHLPSEHVGTDQFLQGARFEDVHNPGVESVAGL